MIYYLPVRFSWHRLVPVLGLLALGSCTPPEQTHVDLLVWVVANNTPDTLVVTVRYPLDSTQLTIADASHLQRVWHIDSAAYEGRGFLRHPLRRLSRHQSKWYQVDTHQSEVNPFLDDTPKVYAGRLDSLSAWIHFGANTLATYKPTGRVAHIDQLHGIITYSIAPYQKQVLTTDLGLNPDSKAIVALSLTQDNTSRILLPGSSLATLFHAVENLPTKDYNLHQRQLTIGPTLQVEE
ncbi:hypothetical protein SAMN04488069_1342 [Hymenobacter psychrophilus]|uniref:Uncharacterized protein n=1 Tax=Hymenobacter psychrophilus TaxID=651662 RepID=A0A1H3PIH2_9BACT|nr:hypothetical protein SAMN04488069_1342 [Hymenobacter psychrophilus]